MTEARRPRVLLATGALAGLLLVAHGLLRRERPAVPEGAVALVGEVPVTADAYARAIAAVAADRREALDPALRKHVLDRLVDEELLVQAALASGLPQRDPVLRGQIAGAMIDLVIADKKTPTEAELEAHFSTHAGVFARGGRVRIEALWFSGGDAKVRAAVARARWSAGEAAEGDAPALLVPKGLVPQLKLSDYLGAPVALAVAALPVNGITAPILSEAGVWVVRLLERKDGEAPAFDSVRELVLADFLRARDDLALRQWLERRRRETRVALREPLP